MGHGDTTGAHSARSGPRVLSIVERIEQKQLERLRRQTAKLHVRELEAAIQWFDLTKQLENLDLDAEIAGLAAARSVEARRDRGGMRCVRGLRSCLRGEVEAGHAEWAEVVVEVPELALPHLLRARWQMQSDPGAALAHFDRAAEIEPTDASIYWRRGECYVKIGDHARALANYRRALALDPASYDGLFAMGKALVALGKPAEAIPYYDQAIARAPRYVDFYEARALALEVTNDLAAAVRDYERALELDPTRVVARYCRARCLGEAGELDRAIDELTELGAQSPEVHHFHLLRGKLLLKQERLAPALEALSRVVDLAPAEHEAWGQRALVHARLGERERALGDIERAVELAPERSEYVYMLLALRNHGRDAAERIAALAGPIEQFPETGLFLQERAEIYAEQDDHERALADWDRLLASWPRDAELHRRRGRTLGALERFPEALEAIGRALELEPESAVSYALRANFTSHVGGDDALIAADWDRAVELAPDDVGIRYHRGCHHMRQHRYGAAVGELDRFLAVVPTHGEAHYERAHCRRRLDEEHAGDDEWEEPDELVARLEACVADLDRALELGYREEEVFLELHWTHWELDDLDAAVAALERGMEAHPGVPSFYRARALARLEVEDTEGAAADDAMADQLEAAAGLSSG